MPPSAPAAASTLASTETWSVTSQVKGVMPGSDAGYVTGSCLNIDGGTSGFRVPSR